MGTTGHRLALRRSCLRRSSSAPRRHYSPPGKLSRPRCSSNRRPSVIHRSQQLMVLARRMFMRSLRSCRMHMRVASGRLLSRRRPRSQSPSTAVEAHMGPCRATRHTPFVHVAESSPTHAIHRTVVIKRAILPVPATIPKTAIPKSIIHAAIEPDRRAPIACVPNKGATTPAPISWSPQHPNLRRLNPSPWNPEISLRPISPIARRPQITRLRAFRLLISHQFRRSDRNRHTHLRHNSNRQAQEQNYGQKQSTHGAPPDRPYLDCPPAAHFQYGANPTRQVHKRSHLESTWSVH